MAVEVVAPAKLNLALEVIGRRADGYHDIVTVMQCIDLVDVVRLREAPSTRISVSGERQLGVPREGPRNLAYAAAQALSEAVGGRNLSVHIELEKGIPAGLGLGGGSSDAAAVLRGMDRLWDLALSRDELAEAGASVGSDVPFFILGGTALVSGRGEQVEALPDCAPLELTLFLPDIEIADKTRRMYAMLSPADYSDGRRARVVAESLRRRLPLAASDLLNVFDSYVGEATPSVAGAMALCRQAGLPVLAAGSGPGFFSPTPLKELSSTLVRALAHDWGVRAVACRSLTRDESTLVREV